MTEPLGSTTDPSSEAVEAAARALVDWLWGENHAVTNDYRAQAKFILAAAVPQIRQKISDEIEELVRCEVKDFALPARFGYRSGLRAAARVARGETT